jgi:hypothetical protein
MAGKLILASSKAVRAFFFVSFIFTAAIGAWLNYLRSDVFDPTSVPIFFRLFLFEDYVAVYFFLIALLVPLSKPVRDFGIVVAKYCGEYPSRVALCTVVVLGIGARFAYFAHPLSMDEYAAVFQSEIFAAGRLSGQFPPILLDWLVPPPFKNVFIAASSQSGAVASAYWPGFALVLTPFTLLEMGWLCNPVIGGLTLVASHRLALDLFEDRTAAGFVTLFVVASTAVTINSISFYSMSTHLLLNIVFAICLLRRTALSALLAGLVGGLALVLHNPVPHLLFAAPWLLWVLTQQNRFTLLACLAVGYAPCALVLGFGWNMFLRALKAESVVGSAATSLNSSPAIALEAAWRLVDRMFQLPNLQVLFARVIGIAKLWLWAVPGLLILAAYGLWRKREDVRFTLLAASLICTFIGYLFFPANQGHGWGFRYVHSAWIALPLLAVAPLLMSDGYGKTKLKLDIAGYAAGCAVASLLLILPLRLYQTHQFMSAHLQQTPQADSGDAVLVIVDPGLGYYAQDLVQNDPFLRTGPLMMISHGRKVDDSMVNAFYPELKSLKRSYRGTVWGRDARPD